MCRSIKTLYNIEPRALPKDVRAASVQFVRKVSGYARPSMANEEAFDRAVGEIAASVERLLDALTTRAPPRTA